MYVIFEGIDGSGKSTQHKMACDALRADGMDVESVVEPTRGKHGLALRKYISENPDWRKRDANEELRLFMLDRDYLMKEVVKPALASGKIVLSDRSYLSSVAYQGTRLDAKSILDAHESIVARPDLVLYFDILPEDALKRIGKRGESDGFEHVDLLNGVRNIYRWITTLPSFNVSVFDAMLPTDVLARQVLETIKKTPWTGTR